MQGVHSGGPRGGGGRLGAYENPGFVLSFAMNIRLL